jgi:hypothetical protein
MSLVDSAKDIYEVVKKGATIELQEKLMKLREDALALQEENIELKGKILELEQIINEKEELVFDGRVYWRNIDGEEKEGPFCQSCYDSDSKVIRLQFHRINRGRAEYAEFWKCNICDSNYKA